MSSSGTPEPAAPRWIGVYGLATITVGSIVSCGIGLVQSTSTQAPLATFTSTAVGLLLGAATTGRILNSPTIDEGPYKRTLLAGVIAGPIGTIMLLLADMIFTPSSAVRFAPAIVFGALLGLFLGPLFALVTIPLTLAARDWRKASALDTFDRALTINAIVLLLCGLLLSLVQAAGGERGWDGLIATTIAGVFFAGVVARARARRRWLAKVIANELPGWSLEGAAEADAGLPPYVRATFGDKVLTYTSPPVNEGPFRGSGATAIRVARLDPVATMSRVFTHAALSCIAIGVALGLQPLLLVFRGHTIEQSWQQPTPTPTLVPGLDASSVKDIAVSQEGACAHLVDGTLRCWGNGAGPYVATAPGRKQPRRVPVPRPGLGPFASMTLRDGRMCVLREVGESRALCWGENSEGVVPIEIGPPGVTKLALGGQFALALTKDGQVHRWGRDPMKEPEWSDALLASSLVPDLKDIVDVAADSDHACAIDRAGDVHCWGGDLYGQSTGKLVKLDARVPPKRVEGLPGRATALSLSGRATWARVVGPDGRAAYWAWGERSIGGPQSAVGHEADAAPRVVAGTESLKQVRLSYGHACALAEDGSVSCWRDTGESHEVLPRGSALEVSGDSDMICARGSTAVWCWTAH